LKRLCELREGVADDLAQFFLVHGTDFNRGGEMREELGKKRDALFSLETCPDFGSEIFRCLGFFYPFDEPVFKVSQVDHVDMNSCIPDPGDQCLGHGQQYVGAGQVVYIQFFKDVEEDHEKEFRVIQAVAKHAQFGAFPAAPVAAKKCVYAIWFELEQVGPGVHAVRP
jgi:hypothetical protein